MISLFLLPPNFTDSNLDKSGTPYYCPQCASIEGILSYFPHIKKELDIHYVHFTRPRPSIVSLIGEENQSCPVIIIPKDSDETVDTSYFSSQGNYLFVNRVSLIMKFLSDRFSISHPHV